MATLGAMHVPLERIQQTPQRVSHVLNAQQHHQDHLLVHAKLHTYGKKTIASSVKIITFFLHLRATCVLYLPQVCQAQVCKLALKLVYVQKAICRCRLTLQEFSNVMLVLHKPTNKTAHVYRVLLVHFHLLPLFLWWKTVQKYPLANAHLQ